MEGRTLPWTVKSNRHPSSVRMVEALMAPSAIPQIKSIPIQCTDNFTSGYAAKGAPGDRHGLNGYCHSGLRGNNDFF